MDFRFAYESRNGVVLRQYAAQYAGIYHRKLNGMVERRMRDAIHGVASFWFTAWVDAGQPDLSKLQEKKPSPELLKEFKELDAHFHNEKHKGRICD